MHPIWSVFTTIFISDKKKQHEQLYRYYHKTMCAYCSHISRRLSIGHLNKPCKTLDCDVWHQTSLNTWTEQLLDGFWQQLIGLQCGRRAIHVTLCDNLAVSHVIFTGFVYVNRTEENKLKYNECLCDISIDMAFFFLAFIIRFGVYY